MRLSSRINYWLKLKYLDFRHIFHRIGNKICYNLGETSKEQMERDNQQKIYSMTGKAGKLGVKFNIVINEDKSHVDTHYK